MRGGHDNVCMHTGGWGSTALPGGEAVGSTRPACPRKSVRCSENPGLTPESTTPVALVLFPHRRFWRRRGLRLIPPTSGVANPTNAPWPLLILVLLLRMMWVLLRVSTASIPKLLLLPTKGILPLLRGASILPLLLWPGASILPLLLLLQPGTFALSLLLLLRAGASILSLLLLLLLLLPRSGASILPLLLLLMPGASMLSPLLPWQPGASILPLLLLLRPGASKSPPCASALKTPTNDEGVRVRQRCCNR